MRVKRTGMLFTELKRHQRLAKIRMSITEMCDIKVFFLCLEATNPGVFDNYKQTPTFRSLSTDLGKMYQFVFVVGDHEPSNNTRI